MDADSMLFDGAFDLAHTLPDRVRLRWRGAGSPSLELLEDLRARPGVLRVDYRPASRSVVVCRETGDGAAVPATHLRRSRARPARHEPALTVTAPDAPRSSSLIDPLDLDAVLTAGLLATWLADLFTSRTIRLITLPLLVLASLTAYRLYERRQAAAEADIEDTSALMLLAG